MTSTTEDQQQGDDERPAERRSYLDRAAAVATIVGVLPVQAVAGLFTGAAAIWAVIVIGVLGVAAMLWFVGVAWRRRKGLFAAALVLLLVAVSGLVGAALDRLGSGPAGVDTPLLRIPLRDAPTSRSSSGALIGQYSFDLPGYQWATLGETMPTQSEMLSATTGDLRWSAYLVTSDQDRLVVLDTGVDPSYDTCKHSENFVSSAYATPGASFCVLESTGMIAGVVLRKVVADPARVATLDVQVWQDKN